MQKQRFKKIYIEITNVCNLQCDFCAPHHRADRFLQLDEFERILTEIAPYGWHIYLHVKGEPLLHPEVDAFVRLAKSRGFFINLTTNGTLLHEHTAIIPLLRQINLSLHATEDLSLVANLRDVPTAVSLRLWNGDKAAPMITQLETMFQTHIPCDQARHTLAPNLYLSLESPFAWPDTAAKPATAKPAEATSDVVAGYCLGLQQQLAILADGSVTPCCLDHEGVMSLGNVLETPLAALLDGSRVQAILEGWKRRVAVEPLCQRCTYRHRFARYVP